jgi:soluble lytic murein transglycosylase-like protein
VRREEALRGALVIAGLAGLVFTLRQVVPTATWESAATETPQPTPIEPVSAPGPPSFLEQVQAALSPLGQQIQNGLSAFEGAIQQAASTFGLDADLLRAMIWKESKGDPLAARFEPKIRDTSYGLMQVLLGTARSLGFSGSVQDLLDPVRNIDVGAQYLRSRFDEYPDFRLAVASYNSGSPIFRDGQLINEQYVQDVQANLAALKG